MQHAAETMCGGFRFHKYEESIMNTNIDYLGLLALLRRLLALELINDSEAKKDRRAAARGYGRGHRGFSLIFLFWVWIFLDFNDIVCC